MMLGDVKYKSTRYYERLDRLKRRRNWLWERIYKSEKEGKPAARWDKSEASSLDWVIWIFENYVFTEETLKENDYGLVEQGDK
jgi:hypothetical protein